jgi:hypothetical protein
MAPGIQDQDLFRPTLDTRHDHAGIGRPFDPNSLVFAAFFLGPVGGGWLLWRNFRELGMAKAARWCAAGFAVLTLAMVAMTVAVTTPKETEGKRPAAARSRAAEKPAEESEGRRGTRNVRLIVQAATVVVALVAARFQKGRFRIFERQGGDARPAFKPALVAFIVGVPVYIGFIYAGLALAGRL